MKAIIAPMAHQADRDDQAVAADLGNQPECWIHVKPGQLKCTALGQGLLVEATRCDYFLWRT